MPDWSSDAACLTIDPETFFPHGEGQTAWPRIARAKEICQECPVLVVCLEFALATNAQYGIWGGTTARERKLVRRMEGRPSVTRTLVAGRPLWQRKAADSTVEDDEVQGLLTYSYGTARGRRATGNQAPRPPVPA